MKSTTIKRKQWGYFSGTNRNVLDFSLLESLADIIEPFEGQPIPSLHELVNLSAEYRKRVIQMDTAPKIAVSKAKRTRYNKVNNDFDDYIEEDENSLNESVNSEYNETNESSEPLTYRNLSNNNGLFYKEKQKKQFYAQTFNKAKEFMNLLQSNYQTNFQQINRSFIDSLQVSIHIFTYIPLGFFTFLCLCISYLFSMINNNYICILQFIEISQR